MAGQLSASEAHCTMGVRRAGGVESANRLTLVVDIAEVLDISHEAFVIRSAGGRNERGAHVILADILGAIDRALWKAIAGLRKNRSTEGRVSIAVIARRTLRVS